MYLIFPQKMTLPGVTDHREDDQFEDWLTTVLIENTSRPRPENKESCLPGITDLWMLEIAERNGKTWTGKFTVEFERAAEGREVKRSRPEQWLGVFFFSLNVHTGEIMFA